MNPGFRRWRVLFAALALGAALAGTTTSFASFQTDAEIARAKPRVSLWTRRG